MPRIHIRDIHDEDALDALHEEASMQRHAPRRERRTCKKSRFADKDQADHALKVIANRSERDDVPVRSYPCTVCKGYHLTSQQLDVTAGEIVDLDTYREWAASEDDDPEDDGPSGGGGAVPVPLRPNAAEFFSRIAKATTQDSAA